MAFRSPSRKLVIGLTTGLLIPSSASVLFNVLEEMLKSGAQAAIPASAYDFSLGCAFTIVGAAVAQPSPEKARTLFMLFCSVLLMLVFTDLILRYRFASEELAFIMISDGLALCGTAWALWE